MSKRILFSDAEPGDLVEFLGSWYLITRVKSVNELSWGKRVELWAYKLEARKMVLLADGAAMQALDDFQLHLHKPEKDSSLTR